MVPNPQLLGPPPIEIPLPDHFLQWFRKALYRGFSLQAYVDNMYGAHTGSTLHGAMPTDRLVYHWALPASTSWHKQDGLPQPGDDQIPNAIVIAADGTPTAAERDGSPTVRIVIPHDLAAVQAARVDHALAWRLAVRSALGSRLARGGRVLRLVRGHDGALPYYVVATT